ncbi:AAA family ATPase [bacterium 3DAC]|nr:AAA family ATPase [bacterium 3DAC]
MKLKLKSLILENFRGYYGEVTVEFGDITAFIGKNDVGKSTVLEALDIFFNDGKGIVKVDSEDVNRKAREEGKEEFSIGVIFTVSEGFKIMGDNSIDLEKEYLLNADKNLEIRKIYKNGRLKDIYLVANHPSNDSFIKNLIFKSTKELKDFVIDKNITCDGDKRKTETLRECIRDYYEKNDGGLVLEDININITKTDIWKQVKSKMPFYALFKADRTNTDDNPEIQDPLKIIIEEVLKSEEVSKKLEEVARVVKGKIEETMELTLEELKSINPEVANSLLPYIPDTDQLKWRDVFKKITIISDDEVPLNKRGSGVRRLVLLSFLSSQAKRRQEAENLSSIIYAIEEPETSQHPDFQKKLIDSLVDLSKAANTQVIITTHSPSIAQLLPISSLRLIKKEDGIPTIKSNDEKILLEIAETLGINPVLSKLVICVEGENDRAFLLNINNNIPELKEIVALHADRISIIPMGGSNLKSWVERNYLEGAGVIEFHLYDRDANHQYKKWVDKVNQRRNSFGTLTQKREMENYVHWRLIQNFFREKHNCDIDFSSVQENWDNLDVPKYVMEYLAKKCKKDIPEKEIKRIINYSISKKMTKELFEELNAWQEVRGWFEQIRRLINKTVDRKR